MLPSQLEQKNAAFRAQLDTLNAAQRAAVEQTEGPVLVIAGPGTGKTHILATRIGKILLETDTQPQNILCLTFTDAGAHAMRTRLLDLIGPEAHRVQVSTFHGFCNRVIQENPEYFGRRDLETVTELERIEITRDLLKALPAGHPLRQDTKNIFAFEKHLQNLFSLMKREDWTPGEIHRQANKYLDDLKLRDDFYYKKSGKNFKKGDLRQDKIDDENEKMTRLKAAADLFPKFEAAMKRNNRYDFEDMILWTLRAFEQNENLLRNYQERFLYLLVDEYQDTNGAQNHLLHLLIGFWENPNVFIVGDDDQSIYEFQGARLKNLVDFYEKYKKDLLLVILEQNYRSSQSILDSAKMLIEYNLLRAIRKIELPLEKNLRSNSTSKIQPKVTAYANPLAEEADVVGQIEALRDAGVPLDEVAVLYGIHRQSDRLMMLLEKRNIPFETKRAINVMDLPLVKQFHTLLKFIFEESEKPFSGDHRLFEILHYRFWGLKTLDLAQCGAELNALNPSQNRYWRKILSDKNFLEKSGVSDAQHILLISEKIESWLSLLYELPFAAFLEKIANQSGLLAYLLGLPDRIFHLQSLHTLFDFVQKETARNPRYDLAKLLEQLDAMHANNISLALMQHIRTGKGVQLLSAHGSKGLEFRHVFLIGCNEDFWEKRKGNNLGRFSLPDTLTFSTTEDDTESQRRLFYVACTRAKEHLNISFSVKKNDGKDSIPTRYIAETGLPIELANIPDETLAQAQATLLLESSKPSITLPESARMDDILANFVLSPTAFNRYLRCPLAFYYMDLLKVPSVSSEAASFGQAMHKALQDLFLNMKKNAGQFPTEAAFVGYFEKEMEETRGNFGNENYKQYKYLGKEYLSRYYRDKKNTWNKNSEVERRIQSVEVEGVPLTGVIDRFERLGNRSIRVVDYKTGKQNNEKINVPDEKHPIGGDYWRQLVFYKILMEARMPEEGTVFQGVISYLEPDKKGQFPEKTVDFTPEDVHFVKKLIKETDAKIRNREFTTGCGEPDCVWCRINREHELPDVLSNEEEGLDD